MIISSSFHLNMVYIHRHYKNTKKNNWPKIIAIALFFLLIFTGFYYKSQILNLFLGSETKRLNRLVQKIETGLNNENANLKDIEEFLKIALEYTRNSPANSESWHILAKGNYYKIRFIGIISPSKLLEIAFTEGIGESTVSAVIMADAVEKMYQSALKAKAIKGNNGWEENDLLIILGETFRKRKTIDSIKSDLKKLKEPNDDLRITYFWNGVVLSLLSGDAQYFDQLTLSKSFPFKFKENEMDFLKGYLFYNGKDYVKSLFLLRKSRINENVKVIDEVKNIDNEIRFYSMILEGMIFTRQNLPYKTLEIFESVYKEWPQKQEILRKKFLQLKEKYPIIESNVIILTS